MKLSAVQYFAFILSFSSASNPAGNAVAKPVEASGNLPSNAGSLSKNLNSLVLIAKPVASPDVQLKVVANAAGAIEIAVKFQTRLEACTTQAMFDKLLSDCNNSYTSLLEQNPSQSNAIALQAEITRLKERLSDYMNNYFLTHPTSSTIPTSSTSATSTSTTTTSPTTTPTNPGNEGSGAIAKYVHVDEKLALCKGPADYDNLIQQCNVAFQTLLAQNQSQYQALQVELEYLKKYINDIRNKPWSNSPTATPTSTTTTTTTATTTPTTTPTTTTTSPTPTPTNPGAGPGAIAKYVHVDEKIALCKSPADYDNLIQEVNVAFSALLAQDQSKYQALANELQFLKQYINDIRNKPKFI